jgi:hypothetical protein
MILGLLVMLSVGVFVSSVMLFLVVVWWVGRPRHHTVYRPGAKREDPKFR